MYLGGPCVEGHGQLATCCAAWASDCKATDPLFRRGLDRECTFDAPHKFGLYADEYEVAQKCQKSECSTVFAAKALAAKEVQLVRSLVSGSSNGKWFKKCGCGTFNEESHYCKMGTKEKPCCSNLQDCKSTDPWPQKYRNVLSQEGIMKGLSQKCIQSCKAKYVELCIGDMRETVPGRLTRLEAFQLQVQNELQAEVGNRPGDNDRSFTGYQSLIDAKYAKERKNRFERIYLGIQKAPVSQLVDLSSWDPTNQVHVQCCMCTRSHPFGDISMGASVTEFCTGSTCAKNGCEETNSNFCSKKPKSCD